MIGSVLFSIVSAHTPSLVLPARSCSLRHRSGPALGPERWRGHRRAGRCPAIKGKENREAYFSIAPCYELLRGSKWLSFFSGEMTRYENFRFFVCAKNACPHTSRRLKVHLWRAETIMDSIYFTLKSIVNIPLEVDLGKRVCCE